MAVQFLTILPVRLPRSIPAGAFPGAVAFFPLVGLAIGVLVASIDALLGQALPASVTAVIDLTFLALLSGGLHLDGCADAADGLLGNLTRERRLEVMREGGVGAFGVAAVVLVLLLEYGALVSLDPRVRFAALVVAVVLSRWTMSLMLWAFPYARAAGTGASFRSGLRPAHLIAATLLAALIVGALFSAGWGALLLAVACGVGLLFAVACGVGLLVGWYAVRRVGGCTGDVYGAGGELTFAVVLIALAGPVR